MQEKREVSPQEFDKFWELFHFRHPDIDTQLPSTRLLMNGSIVCNQPAKMPNEEYDIYFRFLRRWYLDNGFLDEAPDFVYIATTDNKAMEIDTSLIEEIEKTNEPNITKVTIRTKENNIKNSIFIKEDFDYFKRRVYIF